MFSTLSFSQEEDDSARNNSKGRRSHRLLLSITQPWAATVAIGDEALASDA